MKIWCRDLPTRYFGLPAPRRDQLKKTSRTWASILSRLAKGMKVVKVVEHSIAEASGIAVGDHIVELAGVPVEI